MEDARKKKIHWKLNTLRFRINILVVFAVSMLTIFLVCNNAYAIAVVRENTFEASSEMMKIYMNRVDAAFETMENYWAGRQMSSDMVILLHSERPIDYYTAQARLRMDMASIVQSYSYIDELFVFFNDEEDSGDKFFDAVKYNILSSEQAVMKNMIIEEIERAQTEGHLKGEWQCLSSGQQYYLVRIFRYSGIYMGGCVNITQLLSAMRKDGFSKMDYLTIYENDGGEQGQVLPEAVKIDVNGSVQKLSQNIDGSKYMVITQPFNCGPYSLVAMVKDTSIVEGLGALQKIIFVLGGCLVLFLIVFNTISRRWILWPVQKLCQAMNQLKLGDFGTRLKERESCEEFNLVNETFNDMIGNIQALKIDVYEQKMQRQRAELQSQRAELQYMKLQINPHFYINCLNVIHNLTIMNKNDLVRDMTTYLGNHLRYTMEGTTVDALQKEVAYVRNYLHIQELRFASSLKAYIEIEPSVNEVRVPPLVIQTFLENTVKYQVVAGERTEIYIVADWCERPEDHRIRIEIWDTGEGFAEHILNCLNDGSQIIDEKGEHYGIRNVISRLHLIYDGRESIQFKNHWETGGAYIIIELPDDGGRQLNDEEVR